MVGNKLGDETGPGRPPLRGASGDTFASLLDRLKRRGTSVLVVGDLSTDLEQALSRRMMGHPDEQRYRMLAALRPPESPSAWFPEGITPEDEWVNVVDHGGLARGGATATDSTAVTDSTPVPDAGPPQAEQLVDRVDEWVTTVEREAAPDSGEIRVGIVSLDVLLEREGVGAPRAVAERVHNLMREHQGVAHLYFPRQRSSPVVQQITVWVDVVVEVRTTEGRPEQRWAVQDTVETSWFPLLEDEPHHRADG